MRSYLSNRSQYVFVNGKQSMKKKILSGVPQGSVLGPLLFLIYINDLPLHLNKDTKDTLFADDAAIYSTDSNIKKIENVLQDSIHRANNWCGKNSMVIHPDKTKYMVITTRQKHQITPLTLNLEIDQTNIEQVNQHKMLGILIDSELNWNRHIEMLVKKISRNIFLITKLKKDASADNLKLFFNAHIMSHLNYASTLYDQCSKDNLKQLNSIHRRAVKHLIMQPGQSTDEKLKILKILPLEKQFEFNKIILMHKIYNGKTPTYLEDLIQKSTQRYASMNLVTPLPRIDLCKSSLTFSGSQLWNRLPLEFKKITSVNTFRNKLFKHLLNLTK